MPNQFPDRLRKARRYRRINGQALSERCGLSKNMVEKYEKGERKPSIDTLLILCNELDISADYMLGRKNNF